MTKVKVFLWRGVVDHVIADGEDVEVEIVHADDGCPELSDEDAAEAYKNELLTAGYHDVAYEEGEYHDESDDDDAEDEYDAE